jgi:Ferritin-like domain
MSPSRRRFLVGGSATLGAMALAACRGGGADDGAAEQGDAVDDPPRTGDFAVVALAASLENLVVRSYTEALDAVAAGDIEEVPAAVTAVAERALAHHSEHAGSWNRLLVDAGQQPVQGVNRTVQSALADPGLAAVREGPGLVTFFLGLEGILAATYLDGIVRLQDRGAVAIAASIRPVELQHAAVLGFFLGQYPVPDAFTGVEGARPTTDRIG